MNRFFDRDEGAATAQTIPLRADVPESDCWDLTPLYATVEAWQADLEALRDDYPTLAEYKGTLGKSRRR